MLQAARRDHERSAGHTLHLDRLSILEAQRRAGGARRGTSTTLTATAATTISSPSSSPHDEYGQNLLRPQQKMHRIPSQQPRKGASTPELISEVR